MKKLLLFIVLFTSTYAVQAQKIAFVGVNHLNTTEDGVSILALEDLNAGEVYYFTENEYNNTTDTFNTGESVVKITITTTISKGNVIFFKEDIPSTSNTFTTSVTSGSGSLTVQHITTSGNFSIGSFGETLYLYSDNDDDPSNGVTEIHAAFFGGTLIAPSTFSGGPMPTIQNPSSDFPNAIILHNFPVLDYYAVPADDGLKRIEYKTSIADRTDVNKVKLENATNYIFIGNDQDLSTTKFTNFNLVTSNPTITLTTSASQLNENSASNFTFTFTTDVAPTNNLVINFTVNDGVASAVANLGSDYTQTGATSMNNTSGTVTIASGTTSKTVVLNPTGDTSLEPDETIKINIASGTGYDAGSPSTATSIIKNDDVKSVVPEVTIIGTRYYVGTENDVSEFSFVILKDLLAGAEYVFSNGSFNKNTLQFSDVSTFSSELKWTAPSGGVIRGDVIVVKKTALNTFVITRNGTTTSAGTVTKLSPSKNFYIEKFAGLFIAHTDTDDNPYNGISEVHSQLFTYEVSNGFGGNIPALKDLSTLYVGSILVDGFANTDPQRLEYKPTLRPTTTVDQANFENPTNWLYAEPFQDLSPIPFLNLASSFLSGRDTTICQGSEVDLSYLLIGATSATVKYGVTFGTYDLVSSIVSPTSTTTYFVIDTFPGSIDVDTAKITVNVLSAMECLMTFSSANYINFGDPCQCDQVVMLDGIDGDRYYFFDTLIIDAPVGQTITYAATGSSDFYDETGFPMADGTLIPAVGTDTTYHLVFYKLTGTQPIGHVSLNGGSPFPIPSEALEVCDVILDCPELVPTLGQWGLVVCGLILLIFGVVATFHIWDSDKARN